MSFLGFFAQRLVEEAVKRATSHGSSLFVLKVLTPGIIGLGVPAVGANLAINLAKFVVETGVGALKDYESRPGLHVEYQPTMLESGLVRLDAEIHNGRLPPALPKVEIVEFGGASTIQKTNLSWLISGREFVCPVCGGLLFGGRCLRCNPGSLVYRATHSSLAEAAKVPGASVIRVKSTRCQSCKNMCYAHMPFAVLDKLNNYVCWSCGGVVQW